MQTDSGALTGTFKQINGVTVLTQIHALREKFLVVGVKTAVNHNIALGSSVRVHFEKRQSIGFIGNLHLFHNGMFSCKKIFKVSKEKLAGFSPAS